MTLGTEHQQKQSIYEKKILIYFFSSECRPAASVNK